MPLSSNRQFPNVYCCLRRYEENRNKFVLCYVDTGSRCSAAQSYLPTTSAKKRDTSAEYTAGLAGLAETAKPKKKKVGDSKQMVPRQSPSNNCKQCRRKEEKAVQNTMVLAMSVKTNEDAEKITKCKVFKSVKGEWKLKTVSLALMATPEF